MFSSHGHSSVHTGNDKLISETINVKRDWLFIYSVGFDKL